MLATGLLPTTLETVSVPVYLNGLIWTQALPHLSDRAGEKTEHRLFLLQQAIVNFRIPHSNPGSADSG